MGIRHLLLLLIYLDPLCVLSTAVNKKSRNAPKRTPKVKEVNSSVAPTAPPRRVTQLHAPAVGDHDTCLGYYDVSGQYDKEFACNNTDHRYCCGSCFLRFCCPVKAKRLEQKACTNYNTPDWIKTQPPSPAPTGDTYDPALDQTNTTVYITCGVIAFIIILGISVKVAYDKATRPPQEMNVHRALADILRQQGASSMSQYEEENMVVAVDGSPKDSTPVRSSKNHYTPVHNKANHGHHGKDHLRGGQDMHDFISSGFVTLGRGHLKAQQSVDDLGQLSWQASLDVPHYNDHHHDYGSHLDLTRPLTPKIEKPRKNNILTSQTEPYDLAFSRSFQNLTHLPPTYEMAIKADLRDKDFDDFYMKKHLLPDVTPRGMNLQTHMMKLAPESPAQRQKPRRVQRAMSQDHVLSPARTPKPPRDYAGPLGLSPYHSRVLSQERLLSPSRLHSQDPLLSPDKLLSLHRVREKAMSRALSHTDMFMTAGPVAPVTPVTPVRDRHYKMAKMHSQPSTSIEAYNTLSVGGPQTANKRQAFASRRTHTVDHLQYIPGHQHHQYRTASKTEVTV
ncbi:protein shisa-6 isoform X2 [Brachyhypopomus gauderio]|uniref:protein shisa-6 isoform X2 n=1 Tax=Brachyhypopomus gauderio TaxID=698409 RepID=UPI004041EBF8